VRLLGYSLGALVVYEMAALLRARGVDVTHLFLVDTYAAVPSATIRNVDDDLTPAGMLGQSLDGDFDLSLLAGVGPDDEPALLLDYARARGRVPETYTVDDVARLLAVVRSHAASLEQYEASAKDLDVDATVFRVPLDDGAPRDMWWSEAVAGDLTVVEMEGPHHRLLDHPNVDVIARRVVDVATGAGSGTSAA
jgi:thioesterase domain-containing protein